MKKKIGVLILLSTFLVACSKEVLPLEFIPFTNYIEDPVDTKKDYQGDGYYQMKEVDNIHLYDEFPGQNNISEISTVMDLNRAGNKRILNSLGEARLLVVPITFKGRDTGVLDNKRICIQNAFFGDDPMNSYYSVTSFYNKSSYGHLTITGEVTNWITYPKSVEEIDKNQTSSRDAIIEYVYNALMEQGFDFSSYCTIDDHYLDAVYFVYDYPYSKDNNDKDIFWAITEHKDNTSNMLANYSWSSFYFMQEEGGDVLSSHIVSANTYIHETGHLLGLMDYYNTSSYSYQPTGCMDMMDYNIGDHNSFSKYVLDWATPYVVDDECTITISPFSSSGQSILVPSDKYSNSPFGEYLMIEYYVPHGLNETSRFSSYSYKNDKGETKVFNYPNVYGVKIYHINARLGYYPHRPAEPFAFIDDDINIIKSKYNPRLTYIDFYYDNSAINDRTPVLVHLLEATGENSFVHGECASNQTLLRDGTIFNKDIFEGFTFSSGYKLPYQFSVTDFREDSVSITFKKI